MQLSLLLLVPTKRLKRAGKKEKRNKSRPKKRRKGENKATTQYDSANSLSLSRLLFPLLSLSLFRAYIRAIYIYANTRKGKWLWQHQLLQSALRPREGRPFLRCLKGQKRPCNRETSVYSDHPLPNFRNPISVDQIILCCSETSIGGFWGSKTLKYLVRI